MCITGTMSRVPVAGEPVETARVTRRTGLAVEPPYRTGWLSGHSHAGMHCHDLAIVSIWVGEIAGSTMRPRQGIGGKLMDRTAQDQTIPLHLHGCQKDFLVQTGRKSARQSLLALLLWPLVLNTPAAPAVRTFFHEA